MVHKIGILLFNSKKYARGGRQRDLCCPGVELSLGGSLQKGLPCVTLRVKKRSTFEESLKNKTTRKAMESNGSYIISCNIHDCIVNAKTI